MSVNSTWAISSFVVWPRVDEEVTLRASYACNQMSVENGDFGPRLLLRSGFHNISDATKKHLTNPAPDDPHSPD